MSEHGTVARHRQHQRDGETPCDECRQAHNARQRERRKLKQVQERERAYARLRGAALNTLARRHRAEFAAIVHQLELAERRQRIAALNAQIMAERATL